VTHFDRMTSSALAAALALGLGACSLTLDLDDDCSQDGDCAGDQTCIDGLCVDPDTDGGAGGMGGTGGMDGPLVRPAQCVNTYAVDEADLLDPTADVVRVGMLMPTTGDLGPVGLAIEQAAALAADEINESGGIDGVPIGIISCDTQTDADQAQALAQWLIEVARVPAILGPATSSGTIQVFNSVARESGTVMISPSATSPAISNLDDDGLLWRTVPSDAIQGQAILEYLRDRAYQKIAMIYLDDAYGRGLLDAVQTPLCDEAIGCGSDVFLAQPYAADADGNVANQDVNRLMTGLIAFEPDVLVFVGFVAAGTSILNTAAISGFANIPIVLTDGMQNGDIATGISSDALKRNIIGTAPASPAGAVYQGFSTRYLGKWGGEPQVYNAQAYDAMYLLGFAMAAAAGDGITGARIARNLARVSDGEPVRASPGDWNKGVSALRAADDATFDFQGTSGPLNFDNRLGEAAADIEGWYLDVDAGTVESLGVVFTGEGAFDPMQFRTPYEDDGDGEE